MRKTALILFFFLLIAVVSIWLSSERVIATGTTYYMRADGTAAWNNTSGCGLASSAMSVAEHNNNGSFSADDVIVFCGVGGDFTSTIVIPSSGTGATDLITYQAEAGAEPVINGNNTMNNCLTAADKEYLSISGVTCKNVLQDGLKFTFTANRTNITLSDIITDYTAYSGILFSGDGSSIISNLTVSSSKVTRWAIGNDSLHYKAGIYFQNGIFDTAHVDKSLVDMVEINNHNGGINGDDDGTKSGRGIQVEGGINSLIEYNEISTVYDNGGEGGEGIVITGTANEHTCSGTIIRYNYIHDNTDDTIWIDGCSGNPHIYGDISKNSGESCWDINGNNYPTTATILNETCITPYAVPLFLHGKDVTAATFKNNLLYINKVSSYPYYRGFIFAGAGSTGYGTPDFNSSTFDNNIYYDAQGAGAETFVWHGLDGGGTCYDATGDGYSCSGNPASDDVAATFAEWQADSHHPDANSFATDPNINLTTGDCTAQTLMPTTGSDQSITFTQLLHHGATWVAGGIPALSTVSIFSVGAYDIPAICSGMININGVILNGVTMN